MTRAAKSGAGGAGTSASDGGRCAFDRRAHVVEPRRRAARSRSSPRRRPAEPCSPAAHGRRELEPRAAGDGKPAGEPERHDVGVDLGARSTNAALITDTGRQLVARVPSTWYDDTAAGGELADQPVAHGEAPTQDRCVTEAQQVGIAEPGQSGRAARISAPEPAVPVLRLGDQHGERSRFSRR